MNDIKAHILIFSGPTSCIKIILENVSTNEYYLIFRWNTPKKTWRKGMEADTWFQNVISAANSTFTFLIKDQDPEKIITQYQSWDEQTPLDGHTCGNNCAVAAQWFLKEFANIPEPSLSNISVNLLALGVMWPSFIPCPVTLPGRIMDNAKFHIGIRDNAAIIREYSYWFLYTKTQRSPQIQQSKKHHNLLIFIRKGSSLPHLF